MLEGKGRDKDKEKEKERETKKRQKGKERNRSPKTTPCVFRPPQARAMVGNAWSP
jgi:hypothetical protein